ncbi:hypothetical protein QYM36_016079 [Artemia franciscana]|nr:hypothetical protein QYM36_016079 [Artemia franciscana]
MFLGEMLCLLVFKTAYYYRKYQEAQVGDMTPLIRGDVSFSPFIFLPPALLDMLGTSIMYIGLNLTYASSFQMLRGSVIIFTALLSVAFLGRSLHVREWIGMLTVVVGLTVVGASDFLFGQTGSSYPVNNIITGDLLIIMAQIIVATQMVYEEKYVVKNNVPALQAVGWEGVFGFSSLALLLIPMYYIRVGPPFGNGPNGNLEDPFDAFVQMQNNPLIIVATIGTIISIAFFNFAGISVTKELSATTRMVLDSVRTLIIWGISLAFQWQQFYYLQVIGFMVLVLGMCTYNNILPKSWQGCCGRCRGRETLPENEQPIPSGFGSSCIANVTPQLQESPRNPENTN